MKKTGIIGGSDFIGSHTTKRFLEAGYQLKVSATDILRMLNRQVPVHKPKTVYGNSLAKQDLGVDFLSAKKSLHEY